MASVITLRSGPVRRARRAAPALPVFTVLALLVGCGATPPSVPATDRYVAIGDSYTAGVGLEPVTSSLCARSSANYAGKLAGKLGYDTYTDVSCGGATSAHMTEPQQATQGTNPPQFDALSEDTRLVTIGIGLNNFALSYYLIYACLPTGGKALKACTDYLSMSEATVENYLTQMGEKVAANLAEAKRRAPNAQIVLIGYPRLLPATGTCPDLVPLPSLVLQRLRTSLERTNQILSSVARAAEVDYVDMYTASVGHDICSDAPWVNGRFKQEGIALPFHPFAEYHEAVAAELASLLAKK